MSVVNKFNKIRTIFLICLKSILIQKRIYLMNTPTHENIGDHAITKGELEFFHKYFPDYSIIEITEKDWPHKVEMQCILKFVIKKDDLIVFHGGGYLGDLWPRHEILMKEIISAFPKNPKVVFPQTCYFSQGIHHDKLIRESHDFYKQFKNLYFIARDKASYELLSQHIIEESKCRLFPDIVTILNECKNNTRNGILLCFREDKEKILEEENIKGVIKYFNEKNIFTKKTDTLSINTNIEPSTREKELKIKFDEWRRAQLVITDRLHGMIFAAITGTPCIALDNVSKKVSGVYEWIKYLDYIKCITDSKISENLIEEMLVKEKCVYDNSFLEKYFDSMADDLKLLL